MSMPGYCSEALTRFRHKAGKLMDQPHQHAIPVYGAEIQYTKLVDTSVTLGDEYKKFIQQVTGTFLYYARAVDATILLALSAISSDQAAPRAETMKNMLRFLDYVTTHILNTHSDASYLCEPKVKSRAGAQPFLLVRQHQGPQR